MMTREEKRIWYLKRELERLLSFRSPMMLEEEIRRIQKFIEEAQKELICPKRSRTKK